MAPHGEEQSAHEQHVGTTMMSEGPQINSSAELLQSVVNRTHGIHFHQGTVAEEIDQKHDHTRTARPPAR